MFIDVSLQRGDRRVSPTRKRCCEASTSSSFPNLTVSFITERRLMSGSYTAAKVAYIRACANDTTWKDVLLKESQPIFTPATKKKKKNDILLSQFQRTHTNRTWSVKATAAELTVKHSFFFFFSSVGNKRLVSTYKDRTLSDTDSHYMHAHATARNAPESEAR